MRNRDKRISRSFGELLTCLTQQGNDKIKKHYLKIKVEGEDLHLRLLSDPQSVQYAHTHMLM